MTGTVSGGPFVIPAVDITPYVAGGPDAERARVAAEIDVACRTVGFVQVLGHGIPEQVIRGLTSAVDDFFGHELDWKKQYVLPPSLNRGYTAPRTESLSLSLGVESASRMNDFFEAFNVGAQAADYPHVVVPEAEYSANLWPDVEGFEERISAYFAEAGRVARTLTHVFADALGMPHDFFEGYTDHSLDVMRMNNYALPEGTVELDGELTGMGEHTDYGIVTVLWADQVAGLQVVGPDGVWHDVAPADGALLVNLGDLTARWTNDRWRSTLHRVKPPIVDGTIARRRSVAYFHDGNMDALVSTIPTCLAEGEEPTYPPITIRDNINAKLAGSRAGKKNTAAQREAERVRLAAAR